MTFIRLIFILLVSVHVAAGSPAKGEKGMVSSSSKPATLAGLEILKQGGNAFDAAVAVGFALAVTHPRAGNIGGGGFMMIRTANGEVKALDFREKAPGMASKDMYLDKDGNVVPGLSVKGHLAAGVPGSVDGLLKVLEQYGTMTRAEVMAPAIRLARDGQVLHWRLAEEFSKHLENLDDYAGSKAVFTNNGKPFKAGDLWKQPDLANTLDRIVEKGRDGFYGGKTAELIVAEMKRGGGLISLEDLKQYQAKWREPMRGDYRGYEIWSMPPPSSGGVLLVHLLNILEEYDLKSMGYGGSSLVHLMVEAERRAYADRAEHLGDPDFVEMPLEMLLSKPYALKRFKDFNPAKASDSETISHGAWGKESTETTHYSVVDKAGNAVSCTTTLNGHYGCKVVVTGAGFVLNNEMDDFSIKPNTPNMYGLLGRKANEIQPHKRMLSSMTPTIVSKDGKTFLVIGSPGGSTIITTVLQVIVNIIDHEMDIQQAVSAPRFHHQWKPDRILYEPYGLSPDTMAVLKLKGHKKFELASPFPIGAANGVHLKDGLLYGAADPRRWNGWAEGY